MNFDKHQTMILPIGGISSRFVPAVEVFLYLQLLDILTTMAGLRMGLGEASPFVRWLMEVGPAAGLMASKLIAALLGGYCIWKGRFRVIRIINYWYAALVVWNLHLILAVLYRYQGR